MKQSICILENVIQEYAWGSPTALPELLGEANPENRRLAELWMGAHPKAPSHVVHRGQRVSLLELIEDNPTQILGERVARDYGGRLPFLFKVLAAETPLSIQAHPGPRRAAAGFASENARGIPLDAEERNYRDDNHKSEIVCALTPFWALNGFRRIPEMLAGLAELNCPALQQPLEAFGSQPDTEGLRVFFAHIMNLSKAKQTLLIEEVIRASGLLERESVEVAWMRKLNNHYPGDIGVLCAFLLNVIRLEPGEAMFLPDGQLHAYLQGVGIELMANSDNVLRGGLTVKHIDVGELLDVLHFRDDPISVLQPGSIGPCESVYQTPLAEFRLSVIDVTPALPFTGGVRHSIEILLCLDGETSILANDGPPLELRRGQSAVVPAAAPPYRIVGRGRIYRASVPTGSN